MSLYNTYGTTQIKFGDLRLHQFQIGDKAEIPDGVYVGILGVVVIVGGIFVAEFPKLVDKWGEPIETGSVISERLYTYLDRETGKRLPVTITEIEVPAPGMPGSPGNIGC